MGSDLRPSASWACMEPDTSSVNCHISPESPSYYTAVVREPGAAIVLSRSELKAVIATNRALGDLVLTAFVARRSLLIELGVGAQLIGRPLRLILGACVSF